MTDKRAMQRLTALRSHKTTARGTQDPHEQRHHPYASTASGHTVKVVCHLGPRCKRDLNQPGAGPQKSGPLYLKSQGATDAKKLFQEPVAVRWGRGQ